MKLNQCKICDGKAQYHFTREEYHCVYCENCGYKICYCGTKKEAVKKWNEWTPVRRQIRAGVFETNSSSVHSIAIPKNISKRDIPGFMSFDVGGFGWDFEEVSPVDYLYTAMFELSDTEKDFDEKLTRLKTVLKDADIGFNFSAPEVKTTFCNKPVFYMYGGYIDHPEELRNFVDDLLDDKDKLIRFLSGGLVFTGNDNAEDLGYVRRFEEGPYHMKNADEYDWYEKGN